MRLLQEDPALGEGLAEEEFQQARGYLVADVVRFSRGLHRPSDIGGPELFGLLMLEGLVVRSVHVAERRCGELVGPGALLRPWDHFGRFSPMPFEVSWRVIEPVKLAVLDQRIAVVGARWPTIMHAIVCRAVERSHALALNVAIHCLQHVELRLLVLFWHLADRFGRVTREGTVVPIKLSHGDIAELIGSQRPSVSNRLGALAQRGELTRRADRTWLLKGEPPTEVRDMRLRADRAAAESVAPPGTDAPSGGDS